MAKPTDNESLAKKVVKFSMKWHRKLGVFFVAPILIVGFTAIFMVHGKTLGFKQIMVDASWLPGYGAEAMKMKQREIKSGLALPDGKRYVGTKLGLFEFQRGSLIPIREFQGMDIKNIARNKNDVFVATKQGVWASFNSGETWKKIYGNDVHGVSVAENGEISIVAHDEGLLVSLDQGKHWSKQTQLGELLAALPAPALKPEKISLAKLVGDLHTGKAFLGKSGEWLWADILGLLMIFFTVGGFYFWVWKKQRQMQPRKA